MANHADGSECLEGTSKVPVNFITCCEEFGAHVTSCEYDIRYEWWGLGSGWVIRVPDGGSSGIEMRYCPHCGTTL